MPLPPINPINSGSFQPPVNPFRVFYMLTGVTFFAFVSGFSACLFDMNQIKECVDYAEHARDIMQKAGDRMIAWFIAICREVFSRYPIGK